MMDEWATYVSCVCKFAFGLGMVLKTHQEVFVSKIQKCNYSVSGNSCASGATLMN